MIGLDSLSERFEETKPTELQSLMYLFWDKGIDYNRFCELPLPYIFGILGTHVYVKKHEEKEMKKAQRKK